MSLFENSAPVWNNMLYKYAPHLCYFSCSQPEFSNFSPSLEGNIIPSYLSAPVALYISCALFIPRTQGILGFSGLKNPAGGRAALHWTVSLFNVKEAESVPSLKKQLKMFFSFFALQSFYKHLFDCKKSTVGFLQQQPPSYLCSSSLLRLECTIFNYREFSHLLKGIKWLREERILLIYLPYFPCGYAMNCHHLSHTCNMFYDLQLYF